MSKKMILARATALALVAGTTAFCASSPATPTGAVTTTVATEVAPANGLTVPNLNQPVKLVVSNGFVADSNVSVTYAFEVASDSAFKNVVATLSSAAGPSGQTSVTLGTLPAGADYYWHVKTTIDGTSTAFSSASKFTIAPAIAIGTSTPVAPLTGTTSVGWPGFTVTNAAHSGPVSNMVYVFQISTTPTFSTTLLTGTVAEEANTTTFVPPANAPVPIQATIYWRATPTDLSSGVTSAPTTTQNFSIAATQQALIATREGLVLWPGVQPPAGANGHANLGDGWGIQQSTSFNGFTHLVPTIDELRVFDLLDRGVDPATAIVFLNNSGYSTDGVYYPDIQVFGFSFEYMTIIDNAWQLVIRAGG